ncbi:VOC family protein [Streptomyces fragilis]|uniref:VOC family protein n=1 Tax=Streptomyces fragilis TaxID=67301 RepID=A0ABV2YM15_9ACTN|nr:VOC family protein [Streptomyces fragilis]
MTLRLFEVNLKARDDVALGRFWAQALGWTVSGAGDGATSVKPPGLAWPDPAAVRVDIIAVPDPETVDTRVHLELATGSAAHHAELVARLRDLGATPAEAGRGSVPWTVLSDPEGNAFCVLEPQELHRDTGPIAAVVLDCADPRATGRFWAEAMGWTPHEVTDDRVLLRSAENAGPYLDLVRTPHLTGVRHRAHLDLAPHPFEAGLQAAEVARLEGLGAARADGGRGEFPWKVLTDPEGNEFCVLGPA